MIKLTEAVTVPASKTDQERRGETIGVRYGVNPASCAVRALRVWLNAAGITTGPIFRPVDRHGHVSPGRLGARSVALVIKRLAPRMGLAPGLVGGHSLQAGLITDGIRGGISTTDLMKRSRHRSVAVFQEYVREADVYAVDYGGLVGL